MDDFFSQLEAQIAASTAAAKLKTDRDKALKLSNNMRVSTAVRRAALVEVAEINQLLEAEEWAVLAAVALFTEQSCDNCGSTHRVFLQFMERQALKRKSSTQRWVRTSRPTAGAPLETLIQPHQTHICADCCHDFGFVLLDAARLDCGEMPNVSRTYRQEDLNA